MSLTPRQVAAFLAFGAELDRVAAATALWRSTLAAQGKGEAIEGELKRIRDPDLGQVPQRRALKPRKDGSFVLRKGEPKEKGRPDGR